MAIERRNPLPVGRYWVDVFEPDMAGFREWLASHRGERIYVERSSLHEDQLGPGGSLFSEPQVREWVLFRVLHPVPWQGPGYPTIATEGIDHSSDTVQRPPPPRTLGDRLEDAAGQTGRVISTALVTLGVVGVGLLLLSKRRRAS